MMYRVNKGDFSLTFMAEKEGIVLKVERKDCKEKHHFCLASNKVYKTVNNKWKLIDTATINHNGNPNYLERYAFDLVQVSLYFPIENKHLKLEFDELFFLQALAYDLENSTRDLEKWLPPGKVFNLMGDKLVSYHEGWEYTCEMPRSKGLSVSDFLDKPYKEISKSNELRIPVRSN